MNRGINGANILAGDDHKTAFLDLLAEKVKKFRMRLFAYCLMDNHYHLVLENTSGRMSDFFRNLNTNYAFYYRRTMGGKGYVFQGRFNSTIIENDSYLSNVILYVLQNPRRAELVEGSDRYRWSSEHRYFSEAERVDWLDSDYVEGVFGNRQSLWAGITGEPIKKLDLQSSRFGGVLGGEHFLEQALDCFERRHESYSDEHRRSPDFGFEPLTKVLQEFERQYRVEIEKIDGRTLAGKRLRAQLLLRLRDDAGCTLRQIATMRPFCDLSYKSLPVIYRHARKQRKR